MNARKLRRTLGYGPEGETGMVQAAAAESAIAGMACAIRPHVEDSGRLAGHRGSWSFGMRVAVKSLHRVSASRAMPPAGDHLMAPLGGTVQLWTDVSA